MTTIEDYFDKIICINMARRTDRWEHCLAQFEKFKLTKVERFEAHDMGIMGNDGCTASHRGVLELICHHRWPRTLVLEDDFEIRHDDFHERFDCMIQQVPNDWRMLYLGAHYAEKPRARVTECVILAGHLKTTSSYGITLDLAREMAPHIFGTGPIDELYRKWHQTDKVYVFQPRLMIQYNNFSDIQKRDCGNQGCMEDQRHENMV